jgi:hypothetical protein
MSGSLKKLLREPLIHFLVLGAAIFLAYNFFSRHLNNEPGKIIVTRGQIASMRDAFISTRQRQPTDRELAGMIAEKVKEEVYYREALALGLDKDDIIIRRRLRQKMEFIANDVAAQAEPSEAVLSEYMNKHPELFQVEPKITFRQIYLNPENRSKTIGQDVQELLLKLNKPGEKNDFMKLGDASLLPHDMMDVKTTDVSNQFGDSFAKQLNQLPTGKWVGPVKSMYGIHLVRIERLTEGGPARLKDIHNDVLREWENSRRIEANELFYKELLKNYNVTIETPETTNAKN